MHVMLYVWRQQNATAKGKMVRYEAHDINADMSFLEMLDVVNWRLVDNGEEPIAFDHDCREGICGSCGMMINGMAHGPRRATAACQLHMRHFKEAIEEPNISEDSKEGDYDHAIRYLSSGTKVFVRPFGG